MLHGLPGVLGGVCAAFACLHGDYGYLYSYQTDWVDSCKEITAKDHFSVLVFMPTYMSYIHKYHCRGLIYVKIARFLDVTCLSDSQYHCLITSLSAVTSRTRGQQFGYVGLAIVCTLGISIVSGLITGRKL